MFEIQSKYAPAGDQPEAIKSLTKYLNSGYDWQTLWGVTGSGKTFTMANIIAEIQKPTLIIAHNKTLAAQLAQEFKEFFPSAAVHYFVSYYDYYQPEAYVQKTDTYIEKEATINEEIDRLRHAATQDLLSRKDVIIVASVSCIYGIGDIEAYKDQIFSVSVGKEYVLEELLKNLVNVQYTRAGNDFKPGNFVVQGDILEIWPASTEYVYTLEFWGDELSQISSRHPISGEIYEIHQHVDIFPAKHTVTTQGRLGEVLPQIQADLTERLKYFKEDLGDVLKYERLKAKTEYDIEMMQEVGYVNGIENYSRYLDGRNAGEPPATLIDYFGDDFLTFIDESHMTIPQIGGMYAGDRSRKENLVENGFRLPSAMDNRPLKFDEFETKLRQVVAVSATPSAYEIVKSCSPHPNPLPKGEGTSSTGGEKNVQPHLLPLGEELGGGLSKGRKEGELRAEKFFSFHPQAGIPWKDEKELRIVPQMIRPTGLLDPEIEIHAMDYMVDAIMNTLAEVTERGERMLITTLTKRSSEELSEYLIDNGVKVQYLHSEIDTLERLEILKELREGKIDVIVGVNLLREGLDLPEVSRIAILDADKQGFLRSEQALVQIIGRAARNAGGKVDMFVTQIKHFKEKQSEYEFLTDSDTIFEKLWRLNKGSMITSEGYVISESMKRAIDLTYYRRGIQQEHNAQHSIHPQTVFSSIKDIGIPSKKKSFAKADKKTLAKDIARLELEMDIAAANMEYEKAAELRDQILELKSGKK